MEAKRLASERSSETQSVVFKTIALLFSAFFAFWIFRYAGIPPIDFNEAYNLQIAESLSKHFCYCTTYAPARVFPVEESTNGIAQYVLALFFHLTGNIDSAVALCAVAATLAFLYALYVTGRGAIFLAPTLFVCWPMQTLVSIGFVGEIWSLAFALMAIHAVKHGRAILGVILAGLAIESKLIVAIPLFLYVFGMLVHDSGLVSDPGSPLRRLIKAFISTLGLIAGALAILCAEIAFSLLHSEPLNVSLRAIVPTFVGFLANMAGQGQSEHTSVHAVTSNVANFSNPVLLVCVSLAAMSLVRKSLAFLPLVVISAIVFLVFGRTEVERHILVFFNIILVFGALALAEIVARFQILRINSNTRIAIFATTAFCCAVFLTWPPAFITGQQITATESRERAVLANQGWYFYDPKLLTVLRKQRAIVTSGWWQFPELTSRYDLPQFYDRTAPANASLDPARTALLFDQTNRTWPVTTVSGNCGRLIYTDGPLVLCRPKTDRSIAFQPAAGYPSAIASVRMSPSPPPNALAANSASTGAQAMVALEAVSNAGVSFVATPSVVPSVVSGAPPAVELRWTVPSGSKVEIHVSAPDGQLFTEAVGSGSATTGPWVAAGEHFYLQDVSNGSPGVTLSVMIARSCRAARVGGCASQTRQQTAR